MSISPVRVLPSAILVTLAVALAVACVTLSTVTGRIVVKGSEPHTYLAIETSDGEYALVGDLAGDVAEYQNLVITIQGIVVSDALGPGMPARLEVRRIHASPIAISPTRSPR